MNKPSDDELYVQYILNDVSRSNLAKLYQVSMSTIARWVKKAGLEKDSGARSVKRMSDDELYNLYIFEGKTQKEIADIAGVSRTLVSQWLSESELTKQMDVPDDFFENYMTFNLSISNLATVYDVEPSQIRSWAQRLNLRKWCNLKAR